MFFSKSFCLELNKKTYVMGILNITPDSFYDGGRYFQPRTAAERAFEMEAEGADIIDMGAMSTRPGSEVLTPEQEIERLEPVLKILEGHLSVPVSIDTVYPKTADFCLSKGASIINDVSGTFQPDMAKVVKKHGAAWIFTHTNEGRPAGDEGHYEGGVLSSVSDFFKMIEKKAGEFGIKKGSICLDPGFGFSKNAAENIDLLKNLHELKMSGYALLSALSAKRFIGELMDEPKVDKRLMGTLAANIASVYEGADIVRVHDVREHVSAFKVIDALIRT